MGYPTVVMLDPVAFYADAFDQRSSAVIYVITTRTQSQRSKRNVCVMHPLMVAREVTEAVLVMITFSTVLHLESQAR